MADEIARRPMLRLDGLMGYESQIAGLNGQVPGQALKMRARVAEGRSITR
jgi:D-serine deaminase-like pyridoxal phosphate-dependent protein